MINRHIIDYSITNKIGLDIINKHDIFPMAYEELYILVATSNKNIDISLLDNLFHKPIKFMYVKEQDIQWQIENFNILYKIFDLGFKALNNSHNNNSNNSYIINMIDNIILFAIELKSSDIHIESLKSSMVIRFRIDGVLNLMFTFEYEMYGLFSSIIKLFSSLDISQTRLPQNSRFSKVFSDIKGDKVFTKESRAFDFRVSTMPTINGESIAIRILDNKNSKVKLQDIGFDKKTFKILSKIIQINQGMLLVTGPTGSGKTTTMYSILNTLNTISKKIITIEDPIEYNLEGIQQVNINEDINLDYSLVLKNILRQDPDIIMIGEIRDEKALRIALQAALTGHLVIATLHTNSASETINRLLDLNAEPFLIASTLKAVLAQRLVRTICKKCKQKGCQECGFSGYNGRIVISELLQFDKKIAKYIIQKSQIEKITKYAKTHGFITLEENGMKKVNRKITSMEEFYTKIKM